MAHRVLPVMLALATVLIAPHGESAAEVPENLQCYKVQENVSRSSYVADLDGLAPESECKILTPPVLACVAAVASNVAPTPPRASPAFTAWPPTVLCYKTRCRKRPLVELFIEDQFGTHTLAPKTSSLLCVPTRRPLCDRVSCAPGQECRVHEPTQEPYCADTCSGDPCPAGRTCQLQPQSCLQGPCPPRAVCVASCRDVSCAPWQECQVYGPAQEAYCADTCSGYPCPAGQTCQLQPVVCVSGPCPPVAVCLP
jgi:hypothetical protein